MGSVGACMSQCSMRSSARGHASRPLVGGTCVRAEGQLAGGGCIRRWVAINHRPNLSQPIACGVGAPTMKLLSSPWVDGTPACMPWQYGGLAGVHPSLVVRPLLHKVPGVIAHDDPC